MWVQYNYIVDYKQSKMQTVYKPYNKFFRRQHQEERIRKEKKVPNWSQLFYVVLMLACVRRRAIEK